MVVRRLSGNDLAKRMIFLVVRLRILDFVFAGISRGPDLRRRYGVGQSYQRICRTIPEHPVCLREISGYAETGLASRATRELFPCRGGLWQHHHDAILGVGAPRLSMRHLPILDLDIPQTLARQRNFTRSLALAGDGAARKEGPVAGEPSFVVTEH